jgi:hypothetical protein
MKQLEVLKKIGVIISELQEQYNFIEVNKEDVNDLELELFVANAHFLSDHIEVLRKINLQKTALSPQSNPEPERHATDIFPSESVEKPHIELTDMNDPPRVDFNTVRDITVNELNRMFEPASSSPGELVYHKDPEVRQDNLPSEPLIPTAAEEDNVHEVEQTNIPDPFYMQAEPEQETMADPAHYEVPTQIEAAETVPELPKPYEEPLPKVQPINVPDSDTTKPLTINEMISANAAAAASVSAQMELQPIKDLKSAINLNDKLLFVKDLFNGYSLSYGEAIEILNRFDRFEEADSFLKMNYSTKNNWDAKQSTADKFYLLLRRRFPN